MKDHTGKSELSRRQFLGITTGGIAGLSVSTALPQSAPIRGYTSGDQINPDIDNTRVVYVHDPDMTTGPELPLASTWADQNSQADESVISQNIDNMARALSEEENTTNAWKKIFRKPAGLQWSEVHVAIKTNCLEPRQSPRNAVMKKFCEVLVNEIGVTASHIHIYDGDDGIPEKMPSFTGLPDGVQIEYQWGGLAKTITPIPEPYNGTTTCVTSIANGFAHILINIAVTKGHNHNEYGNYTMCMKNHFGTCAPRHYDVDYFIGINKSQAILGDLSTGVAKQQLCFIDALWASEGGTRTPPTIRSDRCFMGTFAPVLDYQVATQFRRDEMSWTINESVIPRYLSDFGYSTSDLSDMVNAATWSPPAVRTELERVFRIP